MTLVAAGHEATPDKLSVQLKVAVTLVLFHPAAFGAGVSVVAIVGGVLSMPRLTDVLVAFAALSTAVPEMV